MPNYDFQKDEFHICWSRGDELAYLDRESLRALSTVLSAALNADQVEMPVAVIQDILSQIDKMDTEFAKAEFAKAKRLILAKTTDLDTGSQSDEFIVCEACYGNLDNDLAFQATETALCIVAENVAGVCSACSKEENLS